MNTYVITYSSPYRVVIPDKYVNVEETYTLVTGDLPIPELYGFQFDGWFFDSKFTSQASVGSIISEDTTLYAKWTETESSIVTGIGDYRFRLNRSLDAENLTIDHPVTREKYKLVAGDVITENGMAAADFINNIDDKVAQVSTYINVHDNGY